jgi:predicted ATP-grasp superfamily ATP-dependent carboligase
MGSLTIDLPSAGLLGITNATGHVITGTATLTVNSINVLSGSGTYTVTLPTTSLQAGNEVVLKKTGTATVTIASTTIEGSSQSITITNNQPIRCLYVNSTIGWLIT